MRIERARVAHLRQRVAMLAVLVVFACAKHERNTGDETSRSAAKPQEMPDESQGSRAPKVGIRKLEYRSDGTTLSGYLAYPDDGRRHPGVLIVHEWWGLNEYAQGRARQLAALGYSALAVDMFGDGKTTTHGKTAGEFASEVLTRDEGVPRLLAALHALQQQPAVDPDRISAIGYCFGGGVVLQAARAGLPLRLVASFHGMLATDEPMSKNAFSGTVFVAAGADDDFVPPAQVTAIERELTQAGVRHEIEIYEKARHGFTNPMSTELGERNDMPLEYNAAADEASWQRLVDLLQQTNE